jgi:hypothetical protein
MALVYLDVVDLATQDNIALELDRSELMSACNFDPSGGAQLIINTGRSTYNMF